MITPLVVVFCRNEDKLFCKCKDGSLIRAIGNMSPKYPDELLQIKHCTLIEHAFGECEHQIKLSKFPTLPAYFFKESR